MLVAVPEATTGSVYGFEPDEPDTIVHCSESKAMKPEYSSNHTFALKLVAALLRVNESATE